MWHPEDCEGFFEDDETGRLMECRVCWSDHEASFETHSLNIGEVDAI